MSLAIITGGLSCQEPIMLPPTAVVEVALIDVARMDAPAQVLATTTFSAYGGRPPRSSCTTTRSAHHPGSLRVGRPEG